MKLSEQIKYAITIRRNIEADMANNSKHANNEELAQSLTEEHAGIIAIIATLREVAKLQEAKEYFETIKD